MNSISIGWFVGFISIVTFSSFSSQLQSDKIIDVNHEKIENPIHDKGIPGISILLIKGEDHQILNYGFSDKKNDIHVTSKTLFELGPSGDSFIALLIRKLVEEKKINLNASISDYLPRFKAFYESEPVNVSISHLLFHTSGIAWNSTLLQPYQGVKRNLEQSILKINGINLISKPGEKFEYSVANYDILAFIIQKIVGIPFEKYIQSELFEKLNMGHTTMSIPSETRLMSQGHKIGFFKPREYSAARFENQASRYVISSIEDMGKWLKYQLGVESCRYDTLILKSHSRDESVSPMNLASYTYGWEVSLKGDGVISNSGITPNFSSYIGFVKNQKIGVVVLANSNSTHTSTIGQNLLSDLSGGKVEIKQSQNESLDKQFSIISIILMLYILTVISFDAFVIHRIINNKRAYCAISKKSLRNIGVTLLMMLLCLYAIYLFPRALFGLSWSSAIDWTPISFLTSLLLLLVSLTLSFLTYILTKLWVDKNKLISNLPQIILFSIVSGLSNMTSVLLITSSLKGDLDVKYLLLYLLLSILVYLSTRKIVQTKMIQLTRNIVYDLKIKVINKVFLSSYGHFELIDRGRIYSTMDEDIGVIGGSATYLVGLITNLITILGVFIYLSILSFWATSITLSLIVIMIIIYFIISKQAEPLFEAARDSRSIYMRLLNQMIDGYKELSIHLRKRIEFKHLLETNTDEHRKKITSANVKFVTASIIGESLLLIILVFVAIALPIVLPDIEGSTILSFVILLLYLTGPINSILVGVPQLMLLKVAHGRLKKFIKDIRSNAVTVRTPLPPNSGIEFVKSIELRNLEYRYDHDDRFGIGPANIKLASGEALFIIGGNGSGKTTLAKLLTGLYEPTAGQILINEDNVNPGLLGEYFSAVFNPPYLFKNIFSIDIENESNEVKKYLNLLQLEDKVSINNNEYNTLNLSSGQRKRLALLQCYLESKPIYLFDEWAADQDPVYRDYFYKQIIPNMKEEGKIVIAITHDYNYFDCADKIIKLDRGKIEIVSKNKTVAEIY